MHLSHEQLQALEEKAQAIRESILSMLVSAGSGHVAGPLGLSDIFAAFYFHILNHKPKDPLWEGRDRLILSNGHTVPVRYAAMAHAGYFPLEELQTLRKFGTRLQGHPERTRLPGLETTSGPLGSGLSQASGMALGLLRDERRERVFCVMSDGEQDAGNIWEAALFASAHGLHNLTAVIDRNNIQINGPTELVMPLESLRAKYEGFGWHVLEVDGHNIQAFIEAVDEARAIVEKPTVILAHTIPGKGIPEIEYNFEYHGYPKSKEEAKQFLDELRTLRGSIKSEHE